MCLLQAVNIQKALYSSKRRFFRDIILGFQPSGKRTRGSTFTQHSINFFCRFIAISKVISRNNLVGEACVATLKLNIQKDLSQHFVFSVLPGLRIGHVLLLPHLHRALPPLQPLRIRRHLLEPLLRNLGRCLVMNLMI